MEEFKINNIVELICNDGMCAQVGAKAKVVEKNCNSCYMNKFCNFSYINVEWIRDDKCITQQDGCYYPHQFKNILSNCNAPKNNDGREKCFWCGEKTKQYIGLSNIGNICSKCER